MNTVDLIRELQQLYALETLYRIQAAKTLEIEGQYKAAKQKLLSAMQAANINKLGDASNLWTAEVTSGRVYAGEDWPTLYAHIRDNDAFELLHKRLKSTACFEYEQMHGTPPPGVHGVTRYDLKLGSESNND